MTTPTLPPPLGHDDLLGVLKAMGVQISLGPDTPDQPIVTLNLSHGLVGAVESHAMRAEAAARDAGAGPEEIGEATGQAFNGAACRSATDDIFLLSWRAQRLAQAVSQVNQQSEADKLMKAVELTAGALAGLLSAAHTMRDTQRDDNASKDAARCVRAADKALQEARKTGGLEVLAQLLAMTK
ncbi:MAG: hypothetical protein HOV83_16430 [Catenulispora sp.]|nr:hypothetical protein [Catenulispora sp.]